MKRLWVWFKKALAKGKHTLTEDDTIKDLKNFKAFLYQNFTGNKLQLFNKYKNLLQMIATFSNFFLCTQIYIYICIYILYIYYIYIYIYIYVCIYMYIYMWVCILQCQKFCVSRIYRYDWCICLYYRVIYLYFHTFVIRIIVLALLLLSFV